MSDFQDFMGGAIGGAEAGTAIAPGIGTAIGAGIGGIASLFGSSAEDTRRQHYQDYLNMINNLRASTLSRGFTNIGGQIQKNMSAARQAATRRAAALGRKSDTEAFVAPVESRAQEAGGQALTNWWTNTEAGYDQAEANAALQFGHRDITPSVGETIGTLGGGIAKYLQNKDYISALQGLGTQGQNYSGSLSMPDYLQTPNAPNVQMPGFLNSYNPMNSLPGLPGNTGSKKKSEFPSSLSPLGW